MEGRESTKETKLNEEILEEQGGGEIADRAISTEEGQETCSQEGLVSKL